MHPWLGGSTPFNNHCLAQKTIMNASINHCSAWVFILAISFWGNNWKTSWFCWGYFSWNFKENCKIQSWIKFINSAYPPISHHLPLSPTIYPISHHLPLSPITYLYLPSPTSISHHLPLYPIYHLLTKSLTPLKWPVVIFKIDFKQMK